jgi:hypothetical protein
MFELFARNLCADLARMDAAARARLVQTASLRLAAFGLTAACDADMRQDSLLAYAEADADRLLGLRIYGLVVHDQVDWLLAAGLRGRRSGRLAAEAVEIWSDGGMSSGTAAIHGSYPVPPYGSGILYFERDDRAGPVGGRPEPAAASPGGRRASPGAGLPQPELPGPAERPHPAPLCPDGLSGEAGPPGC